MIGVPAGYSKNPLIAKLGLKPGMRGRGINVPPHYFQLLGPLPDGVEFAKSTRGEFDFIHFFTDSKANLKRSWGLLRKSLSRDGMAWISWPKKASPLHKDLDENIVREQGLAAGLVDIKVCAVDEDWSGLKFVRRLKDR
jgi:hypothetical protein